MTNNLPKLTSCFIQYGLKLVIEPIKKDFTELTEQGGKSFGKHRSHMPVHFHTSFTFEMNEFKMN